MKPNFFYQRVSRSGSSLDRLISEMKSARKSKPDDLDFDQEFDGIRTIFQFYLCILPQRRQVKVGSTQHTAQCMNKDLNFYQTIQDKDLSDSVLFRLTMKEKERMFNVK